MATVNTYEAKTQLSKLLARVAAGEEITIAKAGQPVARLVPYRERVARQPGRLAGRVHIDDDWDSAEVNAEIARAFEVETTDAEPTEQDL